MRSWRQLSIVLCVSLAAWTTSAQDAANCEELAAARLAELGASPLGVSEQSFVTQGEVAVMRFTLEQSGCAAVVAQVAPRLTAYELSLVTIRGVVVTHISAGSPLAYTRFCGAAGLQLTALARAVTGQGEVALRAYANAPLEFPLGAPNACFPMPEGTNTVRLPLGAAPPGETTAERVAMASVVVARLGYERLWSRPIDSSGAAGILVRFDGDSCYALHVAAPQVRPTLEFAVTGDRAGVDWVQTAHSMAAAEAWLTTCPDGPGDATVSVGPGGETLSLYRLAHGAERPPAELVGGARMAFDELAFAWRARGLLPKLATMGRSGPGETLRLPLTLPRTGCYGFALVPAANTAGAHLRLALVDAHDGALANSSTRGDTPVLYHCGGAGDRVSLLARSESRDGEYLIYEGRPAQDGANP